MALHSEFHIPGAFHADGVHPGIFRPPDTSPTSPASSGYLPDRPNQANDEHANPKRKRFDDAFSTRIRDQKTRDHPALDTFGSPAVTKAGGTYMFSGQLDSPSEGPRFSNDTLEESMFSDSDYRRMLGTKRPRDEIDPSGSIFGLNPLAQQQQRQQQQVGNSNSQSWGALAAIGGVMGRIWQFCTAGTFKGFHAGGGRGYDLRPSVDDVSMLQDESHDNFDQRETAPRQRYPKASGDWPEKNFGETTYNERRASTPTAPAPKRRQTAAADDLGKNWVMINDPNAPGGSRPGTPDARARRTTGTFHPSPRNRNHAPAVTTGRRISASAARRSIGHRPSLASTPTVTTTGRPASSASFASPRSPSPTKTTNAAATASFSTPTTSSARRQRSTASFTATPSHRRSHSGASTAPSRVAKAEGFQSSPRLDSEAKKLAARRKREEEFADVRMNAFNKTLQDMIRQGQEALATKVSVEGEEMWEDDD